MQEPKMLTWRFVLGVLSILVISSHQTDGAGVCFRKYNSARDSCKGQMSSKSAGQTFDQCCSKRGQGYAEELKPSEKSTKRFECTPCSKNAEPAAKMTRAAITSSAKEGGDEQQQQQQQHRHVIKEQLPSTTENVSKDVGDDTWYHRDVIKRKNEKKVKKNNGKKQETVFSVEENAFKEEEIGLYRMNNNNNNNKNKMADVHSKKHKDYDSKIAEDDDAWSPWSDWGPCGKSCDEGLHQRTRFCLKPVCKGDDFQERPCPDLKQCTVDGRWSLWSDWSDCNVTCGEGYEARSRSCTNPGPSNGGKDCIGPRTESKKCTKELPCPVDGGWSVWGNWTTCSATCGEGFQTRSRHCNNPLPEHGGKPCEGIELESQPCVTRNNCAVDGNWTEWSRLDMCSAKPCSGQVGYKTRFRSCTDPRPMFGGKKCKGRSWKREPCYNNDFCTERVDGGWCEWKAWSECNYGIEKRTRACECPPPVNLGKQCEGDDTEEKACGGILEEERVALEQQSVTAGTSPPSSSSSLDFATVRAGCDGNEGSGDGSDVNCDQEPEEPSTTDETGSGFNQ